MNINNELKQKLLEVGFDVEACIKEHGKVELTFAAGNYQAAKILIEHGADVDGSDPQLLPPIAYATAHNNFKLLELLLEKGANPNPNSASENVPLHRAILNKNYKIIELLLNYGANIEATDDDGYSPLFNMIEAEDTTYNNNIIELLLQHKADLNIEVEEDDVTMSLLSYAIIEGKIIAAKLLITYGADVNKYTMNADKEAATPLIAAISYAKDVMDNNHDIVQLIKLLLDNGAQLFNSNLRKSAIDFALESQNQKIISLVTEYVANLKTINEEGNTPLHYAVGEKYFEFAQDLISKGMDVNQHNKDGVTPLYMTSDLKMAQLLIESGADINKTPLNKSTNVVMELVNPNSYLVYFENKELLKLLEYYLSQGADISCKNMMGKTALEMIKSQELFNETLSKLPGNYIETLSAEDIDINLKAKILPSAIHLYKSQELDIETKKALLDSAYRVEKEIKGVPWNENFLKYAKICTHTPPLADNEELATKEVGLCNLSQEIITYIGDYIQPSDLLL
jgi:ankyrin repeat protein